MKTILSSILGMVLLGTASFSGAAEIDVMTQNQYLGADLAPVLEAAMVSPPDPVAINNAFVEALKKIAARRPAERARALAAEIAQRNPDVVGLQEAFMFVCKPDPRVPLVRDMGCDDPAIKDAFTDHLQNTEDALRGKYVVAGEVANLTVNEIPFVVNGFPALLSIADRDAILVRAGLPASWVNFARVGLCPKPSKQGCNYVTAPAITIALERGFLAVDVTVKGWNYRVFNTHLEQRLLAPNVPDSRLLQVGQAEELVRTALGAWDRKKKLIVVGDMNSDPRDRILAPPPDPYPTPYEIFMFYGFTDTWLLRPHANPGQTCCQAEDLANRRTELYERIDMIFSLPAPSHVLNMKLLGNTMGDKTRPPGHGGLWPSDHSGLAAKLKYH
jgi:hypothetical protein